MSGLRDQRKRDFVDCKFLQPQSEAFLQTRSRNVSYFRLRHFTSREVVKSVFYSESALLNRLTPPTSLRTNPSSEPLDSGADDRVGSVHCGIRESGIVDGEIGESVQLQSLRC